MGVWMYLQDTVIDLANKNTRLSNEVKALREELEAQRGNNYKLFLEKEQTITKLHERIKRVSGHIDDYAWSITLVDGQWIIPAEEVLKAFDLINKILHGVD